VLHLVVLSTVFVYSNITICLWSAAMFVLQKVNNCRERDDKGMADFCHAVIKVVHYSHGVKRLYLTPLVTISCL